VRALAVAAGGGALVLSLLGAYQAGLRTRSAPALAQNVARPEAQSLEELDGKLEALLASQAALQSDVASLHAGLRASAPKTALAEVAASKAPPESPAPRAEQRAADRSAQAVLDDSVATGRWTADDRDQLRRLLPAMDDEARMELLREVAVAVNAGQIQKQDLRGPAL